MTGVTDGTVCPELAPAVWVAGLGAVATVTTCLVIALTYRTENGSHAATSAATAMLKTMRKSESLRRPPEVPTGGCACLVMFTLFMPRGSGVGLVRTVRLTGCGGRTHSGGRGRWRTAVCHHASGGYRTQKYRRHHGCDLDAGLVGHAYIVSASGETAVRPRSAFSSLRRPTESVLERQQSHATRSALTGSLAARQQPAHPSGQNMGAPNRRGS